MVDDRRIAVVTGASSGIGEAVARALAAAGFRVICAARRGDLLRSLAADIDGVPVPCDVTDADDVARLAAEVGDVAHVLVNNAGGAIGNDAVADGDADDWRRVYDINVIGTLNVTRALTPALIASGDGLLVNMGSTAGHIAYEGGGAYTAAKHAIAVMTETLRLELVGKPVRVTEIAPGMVKTEGFGLGRYRGDAAQRDAIYAGVKAPLTAADVADAVAWVATRPAHVNVDLMVLRPRAQASQFKVHRED